MAPKNASCDLKARHRGLDELVGGEVKVETWKAGRTLS